MIVKAGRDEDGGKTKFGSVTDRQFMLQFFSAAARRAIAFAASVWIGIAGLIGVAFGQAESGDLPVFAPPRPEALKRMDQRDRAFLLKRAAAPAIPTTQVGRTWTALGPAPTQSAQLTVPPNNEVSGCIQALSLHPTNANILYIGAVNGGIWRTANGTVASPTWTPLTDTLDSLSIGALEFDPTDGTFQTLVAGSARLSSLGADGGARIGVLRTTDGGNTWNVFGTSTFANENLTSVAARGNIIMAASDDRWGGGNGSGLFRSTDTGVSFSKISGTGNLPSGAISDLVGDRGNQTRFYAAVRHTGIFRSDDAGATWTNVTGTITGIGASTSKVEMAVFNNGTSSAAFVGVLNYVSGVGETQLASVWRSTNLGVSWTQMDTPSTGGQGELHFSIATDPTNSAIVYIGGQSGRYRGNASLALGSQFASIEGSNAGNTTPHADSREMFIDANGSLVEVDDGGIYRRATPLTSTGTWSSVVGNLAVMEAHDVSYDSVAHVAMVGTQDNGIHIQSSSASHVWTWISGGDGGDVAIDDTSTPGQSIRYGSSQELGQDRFGVNHLYRKIYNTANTLLSTTSVTPTVLNSGPAIGVQFVTPIELNKVNPTRLIIGGYNSPYESLNRGDSVTALDDGFGVNGTDAGGPIAYGGFLAGVPNAEVLYFGSDATVRVRTTAGGAIAATAAAFPGGFVQDIVLDRDDWRRVFVADSSRVYLSSNSGGAWTDITGNLTGVGSLHTLEFFRIEGTDCVAVGTDLGVYCSFVNALGTWSRLGSVLPHAPVFDMTFNATDKVVVVSTLGRGAFLLSTNDPPVVTLPGAAISYTENDAATVLDSTTTVTDSDNTEFNAGSLTVDFTANGATEDRLAIRNQGTGAGLIGVSGANVFYGGTTIGTFAGGTSGASPLVVTFTSTAATLAAVQALARNITYQNVSDNPSGLSRTVRFVMTDGDGGTSAAVTKTISVTPVNDAPTLAAITNPSAILEDAAAQTVNLTGIAAGGGESQALTVTAVSNNPGLIPDPTVTYTSANTTGSLSYAPVANASGTAIVTVTLQDSGGTANGGVNTVSRTFTVTVTTVNDAPTLDPITSPAAILEDAGAQTINLSGISAGGGESQTLTLIATSSNTAIVPNPTVTYTSADPTGSLTYTPVANANGSVVITVTAQDNGGTANGGVNTFSRTFTVNITAVNDAPTLAAIATPAAILEDAALQTISLSGIGTGAGESQTLTVTATSSDTTIIPNPTITYTSPNATGSLSYAPVANASGSAIITVTVQDNGGTANGGVNTASRTFTVNVTPVNDAPTLTAIANPAAILEDAGVQTINLTGISAGPGGESQGITITATSSNTGVVPNPTVTYSSPDVFGSLAYAPVANASGTALITVTVQDDGGLANGGANTLIRTFTVTVTTVNDTPTLAVIADPAAILEDSGAQTINLSGIGAGGGESQTLTVTATSSNTAIIPNPTVTYTSPNATGSLGYTPVANANGAVTITVTVQDNGGTANGGVNTFSRVFTVNVTPVNDAPTLAAIANPAAILEDAVAQAINLSGIATGAGESQTLTVTAVSSNPAVIPDPAVTYTSPGATGTLSYAPVLNASGSAVITVTVQDNGGTANGGVDTATRTFTVAVTAVNDPPTIDTITNPAAILEDAPAQTVSVTGISAGPGGELQTLTVTAVSNTPGLIPNPAVSYTSPNATGTLTYTPVANASGSAIITVTVQDNGGTANGGGNTTVRTFTVNVTAVNDAPTLNAIANPTAILEDSAAQTINLSGIATGAGESQTLTVTATSSNPAIIPDPTVTYASPNATGSLSYTPVANAFGTAVITVTVQDSGGTANGGVDRVSRTFTVDVTGVNDPPTLTAIADPAAILEDAELQTIGLSGISAGPGGESQGVTITATSNNHAVIPDPAVSYTSPGATGSLLYAPVANASGSAVITVTVQDDGGLANGGGNTLVRTFTVNIIAVNDAPTLAAIGDPAPILEDSGAQTINLSAISAGGGESQTLTVTAFSDNPALIFHPGVSYSSPNGTGSLSYTPAANMSGAAVITVTVLDNGGSANGGVNTFSRTFTVNVMPVNDPPTLAAIPDPAAIPEDAGAQTIALSGISAGPGETQAITISASSSDPTLIPDPTVSYTSTNPTGSLSYTPVPDASGTAMITVTARDDGGTADGGSNIVVRQFTVVVTPVNDPPTLAPIANPPPIKPDTGPYPIALSGITAGPKESQTLTVTATSDNPAIFATPPVTYTSPNSTGSLGLTPLPGATGTAVITVTVDDGQAENNTFSRTFTVVVSENVAPTLDPIADPAAILEDAAQQTVNLAGIGTGGEAGQTLTITAVSDNPALIPNPAVTYTSPDATGSLRYTPAADVSGIAQITVTVDDGHPLNHLTTRTFIVRVTAVNDAPTLATMADPAAIQEDAGAQMIALSVIGAGPNETQTLTVTATSNNHALIPDPTASYSSPDATGSLSYTPVADASGTATITVTVHDDGGTADGGIDTVARTFVVNVTAVNDPPTLAPIANPAAITEDADVQTVGLAGIGAGPAENQPLSVTAISDNPALIPNPTVAYTSPNATGTLSYKPVANASGSAIISVTVDDGQAANHSVTRTFMVAVNPINDAPTLDTIPNPPPIVRNAGVQTINLAGITPGAGETEAVTVTASSDKPAVIPNPAVSYTDPGATGSLLFTPVPGAIGTVTIMVTVDDGQAANHAFSRSFTVTVVSVNKAPTFTVGADVSVALDTGAYTQANEATAIDPGAPDEMAQHVDFLVSNDNAALFSTPPAISPTGTLTFTPAFSATGSALVTVRAHDDGGVANGGSDTSAPQTFTIDVTTYAEEVGTYNGLAVPAVGATSGAEKTGLIKLTVSRKGTFTGKLKLGGWSFTLKGSVDEAGRPRFGREGTPTLTLKRKALPDLVMGLQLDVGGGSDELSGDVGENGQPFAMIRADRALYTSKKNPVAPYVNVPASLLGKYTVLLDEPLAPGLPAADIPHGDGFATLTVKPSGVAKLTGLLADGSKISYGNALSKLNFWPLWIPLEKGRGSLAGPVHFQTLTGAAPSDLAGPGLRWFKPANATAKYYRNGWPGGIVTDLLGSTFSVPPKTAPASILPGLGALDSDGNALLTFIGGGLAAPGLNRALAISEKSKVLVVTPGGDKLTVSIGTTSGLLKGSFVHPLSGKPVRFQGVIFQKQRFGSGYFLGPAAAGAVTLVPADSPGVP